MEHRPIINPYLPEYEYIPDGEPHVFDGRVYLYGSHDRFGGKKFCMNDYVCYSADVHDLTDWRYEGVIYRRDQDPRMAGGDYQLWAPDVVRGKDGRFYFYYCPDDRIRSIGVAVSDTPAGKYEFLGIMRDRNGGAIGGRPGDTIAFDPGVFLDEDGIIYLYSGNGPRYERDVGKQPKASVVMTLEDDMVTIRSEPKKLLPTLADSKGTGFEGHEFFEASSIRKIGGRYYLVYSSRHLHELCWAMSDRPDGGFRYGGVLVSSCDLFPGRASKPLNCIGNNHGGIECINGQYYVFYHRYTNQCMFSRQGCAEKIEILPDGSILQVEITSQGLNGAPLPGKGTWPAAMACHLYGRKKQGIAHPFYMRWRHPFFTQDGPDFDRETGVPSEVPQQYITNCKNGSTVTFRYFDIDRLSSVSVRVRGRAKGLLKIYTDLDAAPVGGIPLSPASDWQDLSGPVRIPAGVHSLSFRFEGKGIMKKIFLDALAIVMTFWYTYEQLFQSLEGES